MSSQLSLEQLRTKLVNATGLRRIVLTNQINRLISQLQALIPTPPTPTPVMSWGEEKILPAQMSNKVFNYSKVK